MSLTAPGLLLGLPAPAKLNLFLHITGRRADGYHELQSLFVPIDLCDTLDFERLPDPDSRIERGGDVIGDIDKDLCVRAARLLQQASATTLGVRIDVVKRIPAGSGMGGGSSDAATTLIALNRLWELHWPRTRLAELAVKLGADVPFFLGRGSAFVEGIGERITPISWPPPSAPRWCAVIFPQVHVSTAEIFAAPELTRCTKLTTISAFSAGGDSISDRRLFGANDLEAVVRYRVPMVEAALKYLERFGPARMTGSGSAVFALCKSEQQAQQAVADLPNAWQGWAVQVLAEHPLAPWLPD